MSDTTTPVKRDTIRSIQAAENSIIIVLSAEKVEETEDKVGFAVGYDLYGPTKPDEATAFLHAVAHTVLNLLRRDDLEERLLEYAEAKLREFNGEIVSNPAAEPAAEPADV